MSQQVRTDRTSNPQPLDISFSTTGQLCLQLIMVTNSRCWRSVTASIHLTLFRATTQKTSLVSFSQTQSQHLRLHSSTSKHAKASSLSSSTRDDQAILLYERDESRNVIPRSLFLFSTINTGYWVWYVIDFVPAISAAELQVDASWGYVGLGIGMVSNFVVGLYGTSLVSKILYDAKANNLFVYKHTLPLLRSSAKPMTYNVGDLMIESSPKDKMMILDRGIENFQGHLSLKSVRSSGRFNSPLLLEIRHAQEVSMNPSLLESILLLHSNPVTISPMRKTLRKRMTENSKGKLHEHQENQNLKRKKHLLSRPGRGRM